jgi:hypothetical protein
MSVNLSRRKSFAFRAANEYQVDNERRCDTDQPLEHSNSRSRTSPFISAALARSSMARRQSTRRQMPTWKILKEIVQTLRTVFNRNPYVANVWESGTSLCSKSKRLIGLRLECDKFLAKFRNSVRCVMALRHVTLTGHTCPKSTQSTSSSFVLSCPSELVYPKLLSRWLLTPYVDAHSRLASGFAQESVCRKEIAQTWRSSSSLTDLSSLKLFLIETGTSSSPPSSTFGVILGDAQSESNGRSEGVNADIGFEILGAAKRTVSTRET